MPIDWVAFVRNSNPRNSVSHFEMLKNGSNLFWWICRNSKKGARANEREMKIQINNNNWLPEIYQKLWTMEQSWASPCASENQWTMHIEVTIMESMGFHGRSTLSQFCDKCMIYREWAKRTVRSFNSCCSSFLWLELYINNQSRYTANTHCCFFQCEPMHFDLWLVWCGSTFDCCRCWWLNKSDFFFFVGSSSFWRLINNQVIYYQRLSNSHAYTQNIVCYKQKERDRFTRKIFLALSFSFPSSSDDCDFCLLSELCLSVSISASIISHFRLLKWIQRS